MKNSNFVNATGWPDDNHYSTCRDLATLASHIINDFPEYYHYFSQIDFTYHGIKQGNRNPLLYRKMGVDGLKTGHTEVGGFGLTASALRDGRRLILVVNGLDDMQERADEPARLIEWGFREFDDYKLLKAGETVELANVWLGTAPTVPLVVADDLTMTLNRTDRPNMKFSVSLPKVVPAPISKGQHIGTLIITMPNLKPVEVPLLAGADVAERGLMGRMVAAAHYVVSGHVD
jgi:D-alanyl-D-alanine carboxypeptidase (penicillin-binding protein 5/6)